MTIITDYADPCAVLPRIREAYYALLEGRRPELIEFDSGNGVRRKVQYGKTDLGALRAELVRTLEHCRGETIGDCRIIEALAPTNRPLSSGARPSDE